MTGRKRKQEPPEPLAKESFCEALARFIKTDPKELAEATAAEVFEARERARKHRAEVKEELENGARPKRGRFRL